MKRRSIWLAVLLCFALAALAGCFGAPPDGSGSGSAEAVGAMPEPELDEVVKPKPEPNPEPEPVKPEPEAVLPEYAPYDWPAAAAPYAEVLDTYRMAWIYGTVYGIRVYEMPIGEGAVTDSFEYAIYDPFAGEPRSDAEAFYALKDLDGNGTAELFIGATSDKPENYTEDADKAFVLKYCTQAIVDVWALDGGQPVRLLPIDESGYISFNHNNYFLQGLGGDGAGYDIFRLGADGKSAEWVEILFKYYLYEGVEDLKDAKLGCFIGRETDRDGTYVSGLTDPDAPGTTQVTEEEWNRQLEGYRFVEHTWEALDWVAFEP
ncbi:MAG: hypothetical protein LBR44_08990 [Clostridiales Family XIII bacterium]|jgi:hypothetical protein|nr:hypothetical protein [Clostridiales Family XIII bacterium]